MKWRVGFGWVVVLVGLAGGVMGQEPPCADQIFALVDGTTVTFHHKGAVYNCCVEPFEYAVGLSGSDITVTETEVLQYGGCDCWCCYDTQVQVIEVPPGSYDVQYEWFDYETTQWLVWDLVVVVPGVEPGGVPVVGPAWFSDCYWEPTGVPAPREEHSWGVIKAVYR